jgi:hypothetical protein
LLRPDEMAKVNEALRLNLDLEDAAPDRLR